MAVAAIRWHRAFAIPACGPRPLRPPAGRGLRHTSLWPPRRPFGRSAIPIDCVFKVEFVLTKTPCTDHQVKHMKCEIMMRYTCERDTLASPCSVKQVPCLLQSIVGKAQRRHTRKNALLCCFFGVKSKCLLLQNHANRTVHPSKIEGERSMVYVRLHASQGHAFWSSKACP